MSNLRQDVPAGNGLDAAARGVDALAHDDGEVAVAGGLGGNVVPQVVLVGAGDGHAARGGGLGVGRVHHDEPVGGLGGDDGGDVEEVGGAVAVEGELGEDAGDVLSSVVVGVGVAGPALRELLGGVGVASDGDGLELSVSLGGGEDNVTSGIVLVGEGGTVVGSDEAGQSGNEEGLGELHLERVMKSLVKDCVVVKYKRL